MYLFRQLGASAKEKDYYQKPEAEQLMAWKIAMLIILILGWIIYKIADAFKDY